MMVAEGLKHDSEAALRAGCAFELIHAYSLIHDDLPAMDNDDFRRGKPTNHRVFGEAVAILAGDSLLTLAFAWLASLADYQTNPEKIVRIISLAASAAGHNGMIGGQMLDLRYEKTHIGLETLETIHRQKTGALILAPVQAGAIIAGADAAQMSALSRYAARLGLLFQIVDDILDVTGDAQQLGKQTGRDQALGKSTYPALLGLEEARRYAAKTRDEAIDALAGLDVQIPALAEMAEYIYSRRN
jgi:geranylgeranyl diphosphate synthase type II